MILFNQFLEVRLHDKAVTYGHDFSGDNNWRYLAVSVSPDSTTSSLVEVVLDTTKVVSTRVDAIFVDDLTNYDVRIGKGFEGNIHSLAVMSYVLTDVSSSPTMTNTCAALGSTATCPVCPYTAGTGTCLSGCDLHTNDTSCT